LAWDDFAKRHAEVAVVLATADSAAHLRAVLGKRKFSARLLRDPGAKGAQAFRAQWMPRAYLINREGLIQWVQEKRSGTQPLLKEIEARLREVGAK